MGPGIRPNRRYIDPWMRTEAYHTHGISIDSQWSGPGRHLHVRFRQGVHGLSDGAFDVDPPGTEVTISFPNVQVQASLRLELRVVRGESTDPCVRRNKRQLCPHRPTFKTASLDTLGRPLPLCHLLSDGTDVRLTPGSRSGVRRTTSALLGSRTRCPNRAIHRPSRRDQNHRSLPMLGDRA